MIVTTGIAVHGKPFEPTLLHPDSAQTTNTLPLTIIAEQMNRYGLTVDINIICEGKRTSRTPYGQFYDKTFLRGLPVAGKRTTTLLVQMRIDPGHPGNVAGLAWRHNTTAAAVAVAKRITAALNQADCRASLLAPKQLRAALQTGLGSPPGSTYTDHWTRCRSGGKTYITSYEMTHVCAAELRRVWSYRPAEHTCLIVGLRHHSGQVHASALVRYSTPQPIAVLPSPALRPFTGRQTQALRNPDKLLAQCSNTVLNPEFDTAIVPGPSGVLIGQVRSRHVRDTLLLIPLTDPVIPTRVRVDADERSVHQLQTRAAGAGQPVTIDTGTAGGGHHSGDICIQRTNGVITLTTPRFTANLDPVEFSNEDPWLVTQ